MHAFVMRQLIPDKDDLGIKLVHLLIPLLWWHHAGAAD